MPSPVDLTNLSYIELCIMENDDEKQLVRFLQNSFGTVMDDNELFCICNNDDCTQGLLPTTDLNSALRKYWSNHIATTATATTDVTRIPLLVNEVTFWLQKPSGRYVSVSSSTLGTRLKNALKDPDADACTTIYIDCSAWTYPPLAPPKIWDFDLVTKQDKNPAGNKSSSTGTSTSATAGNINPTLTFNPAKLTPDAKARFERKRDNTGYALGHTATRPFLASNGKSYFYELVQNNGLVLTDGTLYCKNNDVDAKTLSKLRVELNDETDAGIRHWYDQYSTTMLGQGIFVLPMYARRPNRGNRGFTIGDTEDDDLPQSMYHTIAYLGPLLYQHLLSSNVLKTDSIMRHKILAANGDGYQALYLILMPVHPAYHHTPMTMVLAYPTQGAKESIKAFYFTFVDYLKLNAWINNIDSTMNHPKIQDAFLANATHSGYLVETAARRRLDPRYSNGFLHGNFLTSVVAMLHLPGSPALKPTPPVQFEQPWKRGPAKRYTSNNYNRSGASRPGSSKATAIEVNQLLLEPEPEPPADDIEEEPTPTVEETFGIPDTAEDMANVGQLVVALNHVAADPAKAQRRPCLFCNTDHTFESCPVIKNKGYLRAMAINSKQYADREAAARQRAIEEENPAGEPPPAEPPPDPPDNHHIVSTDLANSHDTHSSLTFLPTIHSRDQGRVHSGSDTSPALDPVPVDYCVVDDASHSSDAGREEDEHPFDDDDISLTEINAVNSVPTSSMELPGTATSPLNRRTVTEFDDTLYRALYDTGCFGACTKYRHLLHQYKAFSSDNPCPIKLQVAINGKQTSIRPEGAGYLHVPADNDQGFLAVYAFYHSALRGTLVDERSIARASGIPKDLISGVTVHVNYEANTCCIEVLHKQRRCKNVRVWGVLIDDKPYSDFILPPFSKRVKQHYGEDDVFHKICEDTSLFYIHAYQERMMANIRDDMASLPTKFHKLPFHEWIQDATPINAIRAETTRLLWHQRLGHVSDHYLYNAHKHIDGVPEFKHINPILDTCPTCIRAKQTKEPAGHNTC